MFFSLEGGKASACKKTVKMILNTMHVKTKDQEISMNMRKQHVQTKASRLEELKNVYSILIISIFMPNTNSCCCGASPMGCCKML